MMTLPTTAINSVTTGRQNDLNFNSPYENVKKVSDVASAEWELSNNYRVYFQEILQNYKRVAGYIYSAADLQKLNLEERPKFVYNLFLPILLQLSGNFLSNQSRVEAVPRTPGDFKMAQVMSDILDYVHYTANDLQRELAMAFVNAIIGRVGWIAMDWSTARDPEGMMEIACWDPFRVMWDPGFTRRNFLDCNYIVNRGWYSPEEIRNMYAMSNDDLWDEITEKAKMYMGTADERNRKLIPYIERTFGPYFNAYKGGDQGYDEVTVLLDGMLYNNGNYFDGQAGLFKIIEFHERRQDKRWTIYDPYNDRKYDITEAIDGTSDGKSYDQYKMAELRQKMATIGIEPVVQKEIINQVYQTAVCPAFNMVLYDEPYAVQNGNFKLVPIFCFDFGMDSLDWKSYVDNMSDPVSAFNLEMNTMQTYLMKTSHANVIAEEDAFGEFEDSWLENKIGAIKYVKAGKFDKWKKDEPAKLPLGMFQNSQLKKELIKEITGIRDNALGTKEQSGESGKLFNARVQQTDLLQNHVQDNAISQMKTIGQNTKDYSMHYFDAGRVVRITRDETNPYWIEIYDDAVHKIFTDRNGDEIGSEYIQGSIKANKYDISLSRAPFGEAAKEREFSELMVLTEAALKLNRPDYVKFEYLVKNSRLRDKDEWLEHIKLADQNQTQMLQQQMGQQAQTNKLAALKAGMEVKEKALDVTDKENEVKAENYLKENVARSIQE